MHTKLLLALSFARLKLNALMSWIPGVLIDLEVVSYGAIISM